VDPRKLFFDERNTGFCVYCGAEDTTDDHVPSKVLLDEPFPDNLPLVRACKDCNNKFSADEPYLACLIECVIVGSVDPAVVRREKVKRILTKRPHFAAQVSAGQTRNEAGTPIWQPDSARVRNVVVKLARGHAVYETSEPRLDEPHSVAMVPLCTISSEERQAFEAEPINQGWPEIGSRAFCRTLDVGTEVFLDDGWQVVQPGRYRYLVTHSGPMTVRIVLSEYLACEVVWD
jgi:hypothetical protein